MFINAAKLYQVQIVPLHLLESANMAIHVCEPSRIFLTFSFPGFNKLEKYTNSDNTYACNNPIKITILSSFCYLLSVYQPL